MIVHPMLWTKINCCIPCRIIRWKWTDILVQALQAGAMVLPDRVNRQQRRCMICCWYIQGSKNDERNWMVPMRNAKVMNWFRRARAARLCQIIRSMRLQKLDWVPREYQKNTALNIEVTPFRRRRPDFGLPRNKIRSKKSHQSGKVWESKTEDIRVECLNPYVQALQGPSQSSKDIYPLANIRGSERGDKELAKRVGRAMATCACARKRSGHTQ
jgi:hypothetical protein